MEKEIVISIKTILFTIALLFGLYVIYRLGPILSILVVSTLIVISLENIVKFFQSKTFLNKPLSRSMAVLITYFLVILGIIVLLTIGLPPVIGQIQKLLTSLAQILQDLNITTDTLDSNFSLSRLLPELSNLPGNVLSTVFSVFSNILALFSILVLSIYMSLDWENIKTRFSSLFPIKIKDEILSAIEEVEENIGQWLKGQLLLMLAVGVLSFVGLIILDVEFPLALGIISGVLEIVPIIGPLITAILAAVIAFGDSPIKGVAVLGLFLLIQQLENSLLVPKIMQKVSGFSPLIILIALLIGSNFFGVVGAIVAVPITMIGTTVIKRVLKYQE